MKTTSDLRVKPHVVAAVASEEALHLAVGLQRGEVDFLEIRVDNFEDPAALLKALPKLKVPLLVTVRHPAEGGANGLDFARRRALYAEFLPYAALIDVELRSWGKLITTIDLARRQGTKVIASAHFFHSMPASTKLTDIVGQALDVGADVCKVAALAETPVALGRLLSLLEKRHGIPLSVMGMGRYGKVSRLVLAQAGSALNYGYLDRPNASGQWEARVLKKRLEELQSD